jgi:TetR/AcrR family transcriptional regulator
MAGSDVGGAQVAWEDRALDRSLAAARDRSSERARRLVSSARHLAGSGSSSFTVADVAADAGISLRSFYRHFAGRDDLFLALFEEEARTAVELLGDLVDRGGEPIDRVRGCIEALCDLVMTGEGYAALLVREHLRLGDERPDEMRAALAPLLDLFHDELEAAAAAGDLRAVDRFDAATVLALVLTHVQTALLLAPAEPAPSPRVWRFCRAALAPDDDVDR